VLLHALLGVQRLLKCHIEVGHVDHGLRPTSQDDADFVRRWCSELDLQCHVRRLGALPEGENLEAWARQHRYAALGEVQQTQKLDYLLTAHTANDVAETFLMRIVANKELTSIEELDLRRRVLRPFLEIDRAQIDEYVETHRVPYVEDPTNIDTHFVRNRVRHELLPLLADRFDRSIVWILAEQAGTLARDSEALRAAAAEVVGALGGLREDDRGWLEQCQEALSRVPYAVRWRVVQALFTPRLGFVVGESKAEALLELLCGQETVVDVGGGIVVEQASAGLTIGRRAPSSGK